MQILDGKRIAAELRAHLKRDIQNSHIMPGLAAVLVGDDSASKLYISLKEKAAQEVGIYFERIELPVSATQNALIRTIHALNDRADIHGIVVQLPLPQHLNTSKIINTVSADKDVDAFHSETVKQILSNEHEIVSPVHAAVLRLIKEIPISLEDKKVALLANSQEFSTPLVCLLEQQGAEVATLLQKEKYKQYTAQADIVIVAVGKAHMIKNEDIKKDAILIDIGTNKLSDGRVVGDVDFESVKDKASFTSPVPGGVGPLTVAYLLKNTFKRAAQLNSPRV